MIADSSPSATENLIAVAASGGLDSLAALLRLRESGHKVCAVHGLFGQTLDLGTEAENRAAREQSDQTLDYLHNTCGTLGIPLHVADCSQAFLERVVRPFVASYAAGCTPNPCALCNAAIKFGILADKARALGASSLGTGHYAKIIYPEASPAAQTGAAAFFAAADPDAAPDAAKEGKAQTARNEPIDAQEASAWPALVQGDDAAKEQSYFLALVPLRQLVYARFPVGGCRKADLAAQLRAQGIQPAHQKESQEVCFVPGDAYRDFLPRAAERLGIALPGPGQMRLSADDYLLGRHKGLWQYTEGQRKGLGIGWKEPLFVIRKDLHNNTLLLGSRQDACSSGCTASDLNILYPPALWPETVYVKTRYREHPRPATVSWEAGAAGFGGLGGLGGPGGYMHIHYRRKEGVAAAGQIAAVYIPFVSPSTPPAVRPAARPAVREEPAAPLPQATDSGQPGTLRLVAGGIICRSF